ncbi:hypothetical protein PUNSTDRAFT_137944 [Punctularia strigosozonata HHB-11173 SS5]|uniref:DUF6534 domain-containing protein n=1 Tax=Punctularia strigosozonata (strain HHB-11173) TaxID=741275 RepID=R7S5I1_PUNST|nr:uncharacterized protein PUNSTDRAFT_137944 [Punctularia strigosozonata HHB-11173 SS5]EIN05259.1 hypothetical protein PUNSTDRAFT_137944 [Punctularia strigosozonata HHB-11173 SS5]
MFGVTNLQAYIYYHRYPRDHQLYKIAIGVLWLFDTLILALNVHAVYYYTITNFSNEIALLFVVWSFKLQVALTSVMIPMVQSLYALRLWRLRDGQLILPLLVCSTVLGGWIVGVMSARDGYRMHTFADFAQFKNTIYADFSLSTGIDTITSITLCYYLYRTRSTFSGTRSLVHSLMYWILGTGLLTSACSLVLLITFAAMPNNLVFIAMEILLSKLYLNSFLAMLNARQSLRERHQSRSFTQSTQRSDRIAICVSKEYDVELSPPSPVRTGVGIAAPPKAKLSA